MRSHTHHIAGWFDRSLLRSSRIVLDKKVHCTTVKTGSCESGNACMPDTCLLPSTNIGSNSRIFLTLPSYLWVICIRFTSPPPTHPSDTAFICACVFWSEPWITSSSLHVPFRTLHRCRASIIMTRQKSVRGVVTAPRQVLHYPGGGGGG